MFWTLKHPSAFLSAFLTLLLLNFIQAVHRASIAYVNSSFLGKIFSPSEVGILYVLASSFAIGALIVLPHFIRHIGAFTLFLFAVPILQLSVFFFGFSNSPIPLIVFFVIQIILLNVIRYVLDLYLEAISKNEGRTGNSRGLFLNASILGWLIGPMAASFFVTGDFFSPLYAFSALVLAPMFFIGIHLLRKIPSKVPRPNTFLKNVKNIFCCLPNVRNVMVVHLLLRILFAMAIIYIPLYLFEEGGYSWRIIGIIMSLLIVPFFLEVPIGFLADKFWGEKEMMTGGIIIIVLSYFLLSFISVSAIILWTAVLIFSRVGAAIVEITTESYFFKQVTERDAELISAFRIIIPLSGIAAPLIAVIALQFVPFSALFAIFGALMLAGVPYALRLVDTR